VIKRLKVTWYLLIGRLMVAEHTTPLHEPNSKGQTIYSLLTVQVIPFEYFFSVHQTTFLRHKLMTFFSEFLQVMRHFVFTRCGSQVIATNGVMCQKT
jgi:hypothetical protein